MEIEQEQMEQVSGENATPSPEASESAPQQVAEGQQEQTQARSNDVPFHEHPRFKELVSQKNEYADQIKQLQRQIGELSRPKDLPKEDPLLTRLKGIDPEFGARFEQLSATQQELQELRTWKQQMETERVREQAVRSIGDMHESNKVPSELRPMYEAMIEQRARANPNLGLKDLPGVYKDIHDSFSKYLEGTKRQVTESYVKDKKKDASLPASTSKGKAVEPGKNFQFSKNPDEARAQLVSRITQLSRANNEA